MKISHLAPRLGQVKAIIYQVLWNLLNNTWDTESRNWDQL
jgi:hypothetical protein